MQRSTSSKSMNGLSRTSTTLGYETVSAANCDHAPKNCLASPSRQINPSMERADVRCGSWLRENSEIEFANGNFVSTSINLKNKSAGDGCRDKTIEKTILRAFRARTFSRSLGQNRKSSMRANVFRCSPNNGHCQYTSACPFRAQYQT